MAKPPAENAYKAVFRTRAVHALREAQAVAHLTHPGVKGKLREILIGDLFRPLLPADLGIGTGQIIEAKTGRLSREQT